MRNSPGSTLRRVGLAVIATTTVLALSTAAPALAAPVFAAPAAKRAPAPVVSVANGTVGVAQSVHVQVPGSAGATVTVQLSLGGTVVAQQPVTLNAQGAGGFTWTPTKAGTWTVGGIAGTNPVAVAVAAVPTRTTLSAPNQTPVGGLTVLLATVRSVSGYLPAGTVTFANAYTGETLGTAAVGGTSAAVATGRITWTPSSPATYRLTATYAAADAAGSAASALSQALPNEPLVSLFVPSTLTYGEPATVMTRVNDPLLAGEVATWTNDNGRLTLLPQAGDVVAQETTAAWTPSVVGNQLVNASFSSTNTSRTGTAVQWVSVQPTRAADPMSVVVGASNPLTTTSATRLAGGTRPSVAASTGSGAPVTFTTTGPCYLVGATLVTPASGGTCTLTATSPGAGAFGPNSAAFPITIAKRR